VHPLTQTKNPQTPFSFTPDGKQLAYVEFAKEGQGIYTVSVEDDGGHLTVGKPQPFRVDQRIISTGPSFSPVDRRWLAYNSNGTGTQEVYVSAFPSGGTWPISQGGDFNPAWSQKTNELFYQSGDKVMVVNYTVKGDSFIAEKPRPWTEKLGFQAGQWDVAPDGKRLLVLSPVAPTEAPKPDHEVTFLLNFFEYLRQRVPVNK
jgi:Tol biopolymer transport system component